SFHSMRLRVSELTLSLRAVKRAWRSSAMVTHGMGPIDMKRTCSASGSWSVAVGNSFGFENQPFIQTRSVHCKGCGERWKKGGFSLGQQANINSQRLMRMRKNTITM